MEGGRAKEGDGLQEPRKASRQVLWSVPLSHWSPTWERWLLHTKWAEKCILGEDKATYKVREVCRGVGCWEPAGRTMAQEPGNGTR